MKKIWILVYVWRGLVQEPEIFQNRLDAITRKQEILNDFRPHYDELELFEKTLVI